MAITQELDVGMRFEQELLEIKTNQLIIAIALIVIYIDWFIRLLAGG